MTAAILTGAVRAAPVPLERQIAAVLREVDRRRRIYPSLVASGALTAQIAADEVEAMAAVARTIEALPDWLRLVRDEVGADSLTPEEQALLAACDPS